MTIMQLLAAVACATLATASGAAGKAAAGNPAAGQQKSAVCGACHGADGNSAPEVFAALKAPKLAGQVPEYIVKSLHDFKSGHRTNETMSPQAQAVAEVDMADLAAWFSSQKVQANPAANKEQLALGEKLYTKGKGRPAPVAACKGCHGPAGAGNFGWAKVYANVPAALAPAVGGQHAAYVNDQLMAYKAGRRSTDPGKIMRDIAGRLDEKEIAAVSEYVASLSR